jgi:hypothetical protein
MSTKGKSMKKKVVRKGSMQKVWIATYDPVGEENDMMVFSSPEKAFARAAMWAVSEVEDSSLTGGEYSAGLFKMYNEGKFKKALNWYSDTFAESLEVFISVARYSVR